MPNRDDLERDLERLFEQTFGPRFSSEQSEEEKRAISRAWQIAYDGAHAYADARPGYFRELVGDYVEPLALSAIGAVAFLRGQLDLAGEIAERLGRGIQFVHLRERLTQFKVVTGLEQMASP